MIESSLKESNPFYTYKKKLTNIAEPLNTELRKIPLNIKGGIPHKISGCYYRNGPNQKYKPFANHHLVDGHGMIHQFKINNGCIDYSNRWVQTKILHMEEKAKTGMLGSFLKPFDCDIRVKKMSSRERTKANTNILQIGDQVLAFEEGGIPYVISEKDLSTVGTLSHLLSYKTTITGHPKYDHEDEMLYCLNWNGESKLAPCTIMLINKQGKCEQYKDIDIPYRAFIHDFAITQNYILIPIFPCIVDYDAARVNPHTEVIQWSPNLHAKIGVLSKLSLEIVAWFDIDVFFALHTCNAFEVGNKIYLDLIAHDEPPILVNETLSTASERIRCQLTRLTLNLNNGAATCTFLDDESYLYNFPRIDDKKLGRSYNYVFATMTRNHNRHSMLYNEYLISFNVMNQDKKIYYYGEQWFFNEPVIIPTQNDLFLLSIISNPKEKLSKLLLFNAMDLEHGFLAEADIPHMIPYGFHGCWRGQESI